MNLNLQLGLLKIGSLLLTVLFLLAAFYETGRLLWNKSSTITLSEKVGPGIAQNTNRLHDALRRDFRCEAFPDPGNILIVVKTGATEIYEKLPTQILTTLGCARQFLIFSDLEEQIGPYHVQDALADYNESMKNNHPDFDLYRKQQEYQRDWEDVATLKKDGREAWTLDKYKFLHLVVKVWHERPNVDWYVFIEADTYVVWSNLVLWLQQLSAADKLYLGSAAWLGPQAFAHGGSGYVFSGKLLQQFVDGKSDLTSRYDDVFPNYCCGDAVLAQILKQELDIDVKNYWPLLNGEKPSTMAFGSALWCQPAITMHHITPRERSAIFEFEQSRKNQMEPLLFSELSELPFPPNSMRTEENDWDNLSDVRLDFPDDQSVSLRTCRDACLRTENCFQYRYSEGECYVL
jgi:hypothetical protein